MIVESAAVQRWNKYVNKMPASDLFYKNNFARFYGRVKLYIYKDSGNMAIFPFVVNRAALLTPRYGGIIYSKRNEEFFKEVFINLSLFCKENKIKKIVIRKHPFLRTIKIGKIVKKEPFVYINLRKKLTELRSRISGKHKKNIQKAQEEKLIVCETIKFEYLSLFYKFYKDLLCRKGETPPKLYFFKKLYCHLKDNLNLVYVEHKKEAIAVSIILESKPNVFMMYGAMNEKGYEKCAKHLMIYELIKRYKKRGYLRLVLGTGVDGRRDSVYSFKNGFTDKESYVYTYEADI